MRKPLNPLARMIFTFILSLIIAVLSYDLFTTNNVINLVKETDTEALKQYTLVQLEFMVIIVSLVVLCILHWKEN